MTDDHDSPHAHRNWLHQFLLSIQALDLAGLSDTFALDPDFLFVGYDGAEWHAWRAWLAALADTLERAGQPTVTLRMLGRPEPAEGGELHWRMHLLLPDGGAIPPGTYDGSVMLEAHEGRLRARSIAIRPSPAT